MKPVKINNAMLTTSGNTPFHRRSSVGLASLGSDRNDGENELAQESDTINDSATISTPAPKDDPHLIVTVSNYT